MLTRRRGQLPVFPRRPRKLEQDRKLDRKFDTEPVEKLLFRKHQVQPSDTEPIKKFSFRKHQVQPSDTEPIRKPSFRKHQVQPHFDQRIEEHPDRRDERFRLYWRKSGMAKTEPVDRQTQLSHHLRLNSVREPREASTQHGSRTSEWLLRVASDGTVVPKHLSRIRFPAGHVAEPTPQLPRKRRTNEDKANMEAVLITSIPPLTEYLSAEMIDMIRTSPYHDPREDEVIIRSDEHRTRGQNVLGCFKRLTLFIRNVANEIVYRERRIAAEEKMYREEGAFDDPE